MPRTVKVSTNPRSSAVYQVSNGEELTVLSVTCVFHALSHNPPYGYPIFEWRDQGGGLIYRQTLNNLLNDEVAVSAAADAEPWYASNNGQFGFPQDTEQQTNAAMSIRLPRILLTPGCTFAIHVLKFVLTDSDPPSPFDFSTDHEVLDVHLWVDDVAGNDYQPPPPLPAILVHAPDDEQVAA